MSSSEQGQPTNAGLQVPGLVNQLSPIEQIPFPDTSTYPFATARRFDTSGKPAMATPDPDALPATQPLNDQDTTPHLTTVLAFNDSSRVTRLLVDLRTQSGALSQVNTTTSFRQPIIIRGNGKRPQSLKNAPRSRKWVVNGAIIAILALLTLLTGLAVAPLATGNGQIFGGIFSSAGGIHSSTNSLTNPSLAAQAATQTALQHTDGYGGGGTTVYVGSGVAPYRFAFGNCTYWADQFYYNLTGHLVQWIGNADQWTAGAQAANWMVSSTPHVYSIIVLQPYVQGAGYYGHVAVVTQINPDGSVVTSNMNWYSNGGWDYVSTVVFRPGPGVSFVWYP